MGVGCNRAAGHEDVTKGHQWMWLGHLMASGCGLKEGLDILTTVLVLNVVRAGGDPVAALLQAACKVSVSRL
jgi:hypothetical protein